MRVLIPLWLALLFAASVAPDPIKYRLGTKGSFHYAAHFIALALTGLIFCWTANGLLYRLVRALAACLVALGLELLEAVVYGNSIEWLDVWTGCLGVALAFALTAIFQPGRTPAWLVRK